LALDERSRRRKQTMKNDNQAALDLFSSYSDFMLTDDELLAIHGGTTQSGSAGSSPAGSSPAGSSPSAPSAPPPAPPPPTPQAPPAPPNLSPASVSVGVTVDLTPAVTHATDALIGSQTVHEADTFGAHVIHAIDNLFFGPSSPPPSGGDGGAGGSHGSGGY
jgi:hypothetical protein